MISKLLIASGFVFVLAAPIAHAGKKESRALKQSQKFCDPLLHNKTRLSMTGFEVLDGQGGHNKNYTKRNERDVAKDYASRIHDSAGETVLYVPILDGIIIPGFDGVIHDKHGMPIANLHIKTQYGYDSGALIVKEIVETILETAKRAAWLRVNLIAQRDHAYTGDKSAEEWVDSTMKIFGIRGDKTITRPTRIVIDVLSESELPDHDQTQAIKRVLRDVKSGVIESVTFIKGYDQAVIR